MDKEKKYLIDGQYLTENECRKIFSGSTPSDRQQKCSKMIEGKSVVDIGCYTGKFVYLISLLYPEKNIIGIDYFEDHINIAHLLYPGHKEKFINMSVYKLSFDDESIDCISFQEVIEHVEGAAAAVKEINRVLKTGGALIIATTNPYYWKDILVFFANELRNQIRKMFGRSARLKPAIFFENVEWNRHIYNWTPTTLLTLLKVNGFEYAEHTYGNESRNRVVRILLNVFPFLGPTQILKVRKVGSAPDKIV